MLFGAHVSVSGGLVKALDYASSVGCECAQIFAKSPRQWNGPAPDRAAAAEFVEARRERAFGPVFSHTAYLINLSTDNEELRERSIAALADELMRGSVLEVDGVVTHIGNDPAGDPDAAAHRVADSLLRAFDLAGGADCHTRLLLENTAGAGRTFGSSLEQIGECIARSGMPPELLGVCIDTCHAFAYGADLGNGLGWRAYLAELDRTVGLGRLGLIHANDCLFERGSRKDRHAWIGDGHIGIEGFSAMVCAPELAGVAVVTEMPGEAPEKDAVNTGRLKELRSECPASQ